MITATVPPSDADLRTLFVTGLYPADPRRSRAEQARSVFDAMDARLAREGLGWRHVVRTWFHLDDILAWYGDFNAVRNAFFRERAVFGGLVPASTGVGKGNDRRAALVGAFLAVEPRSSRAAAFAVPSPLQCPALDYSSAFSRAVEVDARGRRHLYVSGTASIDPHGATVHVGDVDGQIRTSMEVVEAILASRGMGWGDVTRAVGYFVDPRDEARLAAWRRERGLDGLAVEPVQATICRDDLLFEIEVDAVRGDDRA